MKHADTLHICYFPNGDTNTKIVLQRFERRRLLALIVATSKYQLRTILQTLPLDKKVTVWIHLDHDQNKDGHYIHFEEERALKEDGIIHPDCDLPLFTTGDIGSINGDKDPDIPHLKINYGSKSIYRLEIFDSEHTEHLPAPSSPRLLTAKEYEKASQFSYPEYPDDWLLQKLKEQVPEEYMQAILGEMIGVDCESYLIQVVSGGFSGAWVLKVEAQKLNGRKWLYLLKIADTTGGLDIETEHKTRMTDTFSRLSNDSFVGAFPDSYDKIYGWHCLKYPFEENKPPLRAFLQENLGNIEPILEAIRTTFTTLRKFEDAGDQYLNEHQLPFRPAKDNQAAYRGLTLRLEQAFKIAEVLESLGKKFLNVEPDPYQIKNRRHHLQRFILKQDGSYSDKPITAQSQSFGTPCGMPHGDLHTANILYDPEQSKTVFIDFANVPIQPSLHRFTDIGKFSSDLEVSIFPDKELLENPGLLLDWMKAHKQWLYGLDLDSKNEYIQGLYSINDLLREEVLADRIPEEWKEKGEAGTIEAIRQFQMVRLHYFLKQIAYNYEIREKILFFVRASLDILDYLIETPYENN